MFNRTTISIDLAKTVFQVAVFNRFGNLKSNKQLNARQMLKVIESHPGALIVMEACGTAHYWSRRLQQMGYDTRLVPPHHVKPYRSGNKNDANDAVAIYEAAKKPKQYFVATRSIYQSDLAALVRTREGYVRQRTAVANRIRGLCSELGVSFSVGLNRLRHQLPDKLEQPDNGLTPIVRQLVRELLDELLWLDERVEVMMKRIESLGKQNELIRNLTTLPGVAWLTAAGLYIRLGDGSAFRRGKDASASLGLVPKHSGSGGKVYHAGISKRGDSYLRYLLVHGARTVVHHAQKKDDELSRWINQCTAQNGKHKAAVALANKLVRMAWAMLRSGASYSHPIATV